MQRTKETGKGNYITVQELYRDCADLASNAPAFGLSNLTQAQITRPVFKSSSLRHGQEKRLLLLFFLSPSKSKYYV
jgi:hypothetical protein